MATPQLNQWSGQFGREYTDRNTLSVDELNALYHRNYGITRRELNLRFLADIPLTARILEVGCNIGNQLLLLQAMGFRNLSGVEIQEYAIKKARSRLPNVRLEQASAFDIPFPDNHFDLVFTSGVLIHISPQDLFKAMAEIHRCTNSYIWGLEYHAPDIAKVDYRGHKDLLWKADYPQLYLHYCPDLESVKAERLPYLENANEDCMFLLKKRARHLGV
jgi:pseudaminic acid biosynthesis-associated methylase